MRFATPAHAEGYELASRQIASIVRAARPRLVAFNLSTDDATQECWAFAMRACEEIDEAATASERIAFLRMTVASDLHAWIDRAACQKRSTGQMDLRLDEPIEPGGSTTPLDVLAAPATDPTAAMDARRQLEFAWASATDRERVILLRFANGERQEDVAKRLGVSRQRVAIIERDLIARMRAAA